MATTVETLPQSAIPSGSSPQEGARASSTVGANHVLFPWLRAQSINVTRHAAALRPFRREEFGTGAAAPSEGHIQVVNNLITKLRRGLLRMSKDVTKAISAANADPGSSNLQHVVARKDRAQH